MLHGREVALLKGDLDRLKKGEVLRNRDALYAIGYMIYTKLDYEKELHEIIDASVNPCLIGSICISAAMRLHDFTRNEWFQLFNVLYDSERIREIFIWSHWTDKIDAKIRGVGAEAWGHYRQRILKEKRFERERESPFKRELHERFFK